MRSKVRIGRLYVFRPAAFDRLYPHAGTPAIGAVVRAIKSPPGCPPFGNMGHCYVASPSGHFMGLVQLASLTEEHTA